MSKSSLISATVLLGLFLSQNALACDGQKRTMPAPNMQPMGMPMGNTSFSSFNVQQMMLPNGYGVRVMTAGAGANNVDIRVDRGRLVIQSKQENRRMMPGGGFMQMGSFSQSIGLPPDADLAGMRINRQGNVIEIMIPRKR